MLFFFPQMHFIQITVFNYKKKKEEEKKNVILGLRMRQFLGRGTCANIL